MFQMGEVWKDSILWTRASASLQHRAAVFRTGARGNEHVANNSGYCHTQRARSASPPTVQLPLECYLAYNT